LRFINCIFFFLLRKFEWTWPKSLDAGTMQLYTWTKITPQLWCDAVAKTITLAILQQQLEMQIAILNHNFPNIEAHNTHFFLFVLSFSRTYILMYVELVNDEFNEIYYYVPPSWYLILEFNTILFFCSFISSLLLWDILNTYTWEGYDNFVMSFASSYDI
jgi:hypothetical protein